MLLLQKEGCGLACMLAMPAPSCCLPTCQLLVIAFLIWPFPILFLMQGATWWCGRPGKLALRRLQGAGCMS